MTDDAKFAIEAFMLKWGTRIPMAERKAFVQAVGDLSIKCVESGAKEFVARFMKEGERLLGRGFGGGGA